MRLTNFLVGVGKPQHIVSGISALEASWGARTLWLCVAPLQLGGLRGKKSTPSVGWEVPVSSVTSASKNRSSLEKERKGAPSTGFNSDNKAKVWICLIE